MLRAVSKECLQTLTCTLKTRSVFKNWNKFSINCYHSVKRRNLYSLGPTLDTQTVSKAFEPEILQLQSHAALLNQMHASGLAELSDVKPMMLIYHQLVSRGAASVAVIRPVVRALARSAKDCSSVLRQMPAQNRVHVKETIFKNLLSYCNEVATDVIEGHIPFDTMTVGTLLSAYEQIDPQLGVKFYEKLGAHEVTGSAIPCYIKAGAALSEIEKVYKIAPRKHPRIIANFAWACLIRGDVERALALREQIIDPPLSVRQFMLDLFVGDAPLTLADAEFANTDIAPHPAAMARYLALRFEAIPDLADQLRLFSRYITLTAAYPETRFKTLTYEVVDRVLNQHNTWSTAAAKDLTALFQAYHRASSSVFLNIVLTLVSQHWRGEKEPVLVLLRAYGSEDSPVSIRVRLNALAGLEFESKEATIKKLWAIREAQGNVGHLDFQALKRARHASTQSNPQANKKM